MAIIDPNIYLFGDTQPVFVRSGYVPPFLQRIESADSVIVSLVNPRPIATIMSDLFSTRAMRDGTLNRVDIWVGSSVGSTSKFDINKNGVSIFSNPDNRPSLSSGVHVFVDGLAIAVTLGDKISIDVDQTPLGGLVGSFDCRLIID